MALFLIFSRRRAALALRIAGSQGRGTALELVYLESNRGVFGRLRTVAACFRFSIRNKN